VVFGLVLSCSHGAEVAAQQAPSGVYVTGNAAVTGFSGALPPIQIAPGVDPNQLTFIDPNGPSLRVVDLQHMGGPPEAQLVGAPKPLTISAALIGQVFGVALDDNTPPNIYAAATSAYGLPIVAPGPNGQPQHIQVGAPNATFMAALWGQQGGPGSIWKINGVNGQVSLFANVTVASRANSGPALGGLTYDPNSKSLFVADRETGLIHRFNLNGSDLGTYDHGVAGRAAEGLPPVPWNSPPGIDVTSPQFDSTQPATWSYAAPQRLVYGLAVYQQRLYYAVADGLQVWSVGLNTDGSFGTDAQIEVAVPAAAGPTEISKITFDEQGRMYLAERPAPTGAFDFEALSVAAIGRGLRYAVIGTTASGQRIWQPSPDEYAIGFPPDFRNDNGGVAIGYSYNELGNINLGSCGGFMWSTGEQLRNASDPTLAAQLGKTGELNVDGLQGNPTWRIKRDDEPPLVSYFIDYADEYPDPASRGHMGDIAIERLCTPAKAAVLLPPAFPPPFPKGNPPGYPPNPPHVPPPPPNKPPATPVCMPWQVCGPTGPCPPNQVYRRDSNSCEPACQRPDVLINGKCCSVDTLAAGGACSNSSCPSGQTAIGPSNYCCNSNQVYTNGSAGPACCSGNVVNGKCQPPTPPTNPNCSPGSTNPQCCSKGYVSTGGSCCLASQMTSTGTCCPSGQIPSGTNKSQCVPIIRVPIGPRCCSAGKIPAGDGSCCLPGNVTTSGVCCSGPVDPNNRAQCPIKIQNLSVPACTAGYTKMPDGSCCNSRFVGADGKSCNTGQQPCSAGQFRDTDGSCRPLLPGPAPVPPPPPPCQSNQLRDSKGNCGPPLIPNNPAPCLPGKIRDSKGVCGSPPPAPCQAGQERNSSGTCELPPCPRGQVRESNGNCGPPTTTKKTGGTVAPPPKILAPKGGLPIKPPTAPRTRIGAPTKGREGP
jgi:hypothetical protein